MPLTVTLIKDALFYDTLCFGPYTSVELEEAYLVGRTPEGMEEITHIELGGYWTDHLTGRSWDRVEINVAPEDD